MAITIKDIKRAAYALLLLSIGFIVAVVIAAITEKLMYGL